MSRQVQFTVFISAGGWAGRAYLPEVPQLCWLLPAPESVVYNSKNGKDWASAAFLSSACWCVALCSCNKPQKAVATLLAPDQHVWYALAVHRSSSGSPLPCFNPFCYISCCRDFRHQWSGLFEFVSTLWVSAFANSANTSSPQRFASRLRVSYSTIDNTASSMEMGQFGI